MTGTRRLQDVARLPKTRAAIGYAAERHVEQQRATDGAPFIEHPLEVGWLLYRAGASDQVVAAGVLHDVLEKTDVGAAELRVRFGSRITELVLAVSEDSEIPGYARRKAALRRQAAVAGSDALMIFAADKVSKIRELRAAITAAERRGTPLDPSVFPRRRLVHLRRCLDMLNERLGDSPLVKQLGAELGSLTTDLRRHAEIPAAA